MQSNKNKINLSFQPKAITKKILKDLKDRSRYVITKRYGLEDAQKRTLESIGQEYGITRERVRQIENFGITSIRKSEVFEEISAIFKEIKDTIDEMGSVVNQEDFLSLISEDPVIQNQIHFYMVLGHDFTHHKEDKHFKTRWSTKTETREAVENTLKDLHQKITDDDLLLEEELLELLEKNENIQALPKSHRTQDILRKYIAISNALGKNPLGDYGLLTSSSVKVRGVRDYAFLVMRRNGSLMHFREVADAIEKTFNKKTHIATTHNELIKDKRFVLVGRGIYGLLEWGYHEGVVRDVITQILKREGPLTKEEIIDKVLKERYLKKNTILVNLQNSPDFTKDDRGLFHLKNK